LVRSIPAEERYLRLRQNIAIPIKISPTITQATITPIILSPLDPLDNPEVEVVVGGRPVFVGRFVNSAEATLVIIDPALSITSEQIESMSDVYMLPHKFSSLMFKIRREILVHVLGFPLTSKDST
jgi:hypothetical protein